MTFLSAFARRFKEIARSASAAKKPDTVKRMNEALNEALADAPVIPEPLPPVTHRRVNKAGIDLIHMFEGLHKRRPDGMIEAYPDPATGGEPWTIGWGSTGKDPFNGGRIKRGTVWTREQCDMRFEQHLAQFEDAVRDLIGQTPTTQGQFNAMVSLCYNIGPTAFGASTLLKMHKAEDYGAAAEQFARWNRAGGKVMLGLTRRRAAEARMYQS